jgi:hypothetical protein
MDNFIEGMSGVEEKKKAWNDDDHAYQKALIEYKHKIEGLERKRVLWL